MTNQETTTLTPDQIRAMPAGPAMNALVSERVMGYPILSSWEAGEFYNDARELADQHETDRVLVVDGTIHYWFPFDEHQPVHCDCNYSASMNAAMEVKLALACSWEIFTYSACVVARCRSARTGEWSRAEVAFDDKKSHEAEPLAICRAALLATLTHDHDGDDDE